MHISNRCFILLTLLHSRVRIIESTDNQGSDNRGWTVSWYVAILVVSTTISGQLSACTNNVSIFRQGTRLLLTRYTSPSIIWTSVIWCPDYLDSTKTDKNSKGQQIHVDLIKKKRTCTLPYTKTRLPLVHEVVYNESK